MAPAATSQPWRRYRDSSIPFRETVPRAAHTGPVKAAPHTQTDPEHCQIPGLAVLFTQAVAAVALGNAVCETKGASPNDRW